MLKNFFKVAFRNIGRNKGFSILNIGGLAIGMASAMLILLWVHNEMSYDSTYKIRIACISHGTAIREIVASTAGTTHLKFWGLP